MAVLGSTQFDRLAFPPSNSPFCSSNALWTSEPSRSISLFNASVCRKVSRPATISSRSSQFGVDRNTIARAEDERAPANSDDSSDIEFPSLAELARDALSKTESTLQRLEQPAFHRIGLRVNQTQSVAGECQGGSRDQLLTLDSNNDSDDEGSASGEVDPGKVDWMRVYITPLQPQISPPRRPSPLIHPESGSHQQQTGPSPAQARLQILPQSSTPLQEQTSSQGVEAITGSTPVESVLFPLPQPSNSGDNGWTDENMAELERAIGLALEEQAEEPIPAGTPTSPRRCSAEALQDEIQTRESSETTGGRVEELRDTSRRGTPALEGERCETPAVVPAVIAQQDLAEVVDADDLRDQETTEALPIAEPDFPAMDEHHFRLRGVRARRLAGRPTRTTQYRIVWGKYPNRSDSWLNADEVQISILCEAYAQHFARPVDTFRIRKMRLSLRKGRRVFEYLVDLFGLDNYTWITEDRLRISLRPTLVTELQASSPRPVSQIQREDLFRDTATPTIDEYYHASRASRSSCAPADPALEGEPTTRKRGHYDTHPEISSDTHRSTNTDDHHHDCDTSDEDPRPAKRRKPRLAPAVSQATSRGHTPELPPEPHVEQTGSLGASSTATPEIHDAQPQVDHGCSSTLKNRHRYPSRTSRSPSTAAEAVPVAEYQEWPFQGFLKRTRIGDEVTYNLEFKLPSISEHFHISIDPQALDICSRQEPPAQIPTRKKAATHSKVHQAPLQSKKGRAKWTKWTTEEDEMLVQMKNDGCSWEEIHAALPHRSSGTIHVCYSTKLKE